MYLDKINTTPINLFVKNFNSQIILIFDQSDYTRYYLRISTDL